MFVWKRPKINEKEARVGPVKKRKNEGWKWLWHSWKSSRFWHWRSAVGDQSSPVLIYAHPYWKDKNKEKRPVRWTKVVNFQFYHHFCLQIVQQTILVRSVISFKFPLCTSPNVQSFSSISSVYLIVESKFTISCFSFCVPEPFFVASLHFTFFFLQQSNSHSHTHTMQCKTRKSMKQNNSCSSLA